MSGSTVARDHLFTASLIPGVSNSSDWWLSVRWYHCQVKTGTKVNRLSSGGGGIRTPEAFDTWPLSRRLPSATRTRLREGVYRPPHQRPHSEHRNRITHPLECRVRRPTMRKSAQGRENA